MCFKRITVIALCVISSLCSAQKTSIGIQVGNNYNSAIGSDIYDPYVKIGYGLHTLVKVEFTKNVSFMFEPGFNQLGFQIKFADFDDLFWTYHREYSYKFKAATLPLTFVYSVGRRNKIQLLAGGYLQYIFNSQVSWQDEGVKFKTTQYTHAGLTDISNFTNSWDFGVFTGIGSSYLAVYGNSKRPPVTIFWNMRYFFGMKNVIDTDINSINNFSFYRQAHLTSLQLRFGVSIPI